MEEGAAADGGGVRKKELGDKWEKFLQNKYSEKYFDKLHPNSDDNYFI